jgi:hypothetical protein
LLIIARQVLREAAEEDDWQEANCGKRRVPMQYDMGLGPYFDRE